MKGINDLVLNKASMLEALQYWADEQFNIALKVTNVEPDSSNDTFVVTVEETEAEPD